MFYIKLKLKYSEREFFMVMWNFLESIVLFYYIKYINGRDLAKIQVIY